MWCRKSELRTIKSRLMVVGGAYLNGIRGPARRASKTGTGVQARAVRPGRQACAPDPCGDLHSKHERLVTSMIGP